VRLSNPHVPVVVNHFDIIHAVALFGGDNCNIPLVFLSTDFARSLARRQPRFSASSNPKWNLAGFTLSPASLHQVNAKSIVCT
jgi:hypothetical protein